MRLLWIAAALAVAASCQSGAKDGSNPKATVTPNVNQTDNTAEDYPAKPLPTGRVILQDAYGGKQVVEVEIATDPKETERGMMWRRELKPGKGMLFVFEGEEERSFWMRNTLIPLDMIHLKTDGTVVGIVENAKPRSLESRTIGRPAHYVLEVPGGWSAKVAIKTGLKAEVLIPEHLKKP